MTEAHPEQGYEKEVLGRTLEEIDQAFQKQQTSYFEGGANKYTNRMLNQGLRLDTLEKLSDHGHEPYFARLDFTGERGEQKVYFGYAHLGQLAAGQILDWRCDLYSLFVGPSAAEQQYRVQQTGRLHAAKLLLKRRLEIKDQQLRGISDAVDYRQSIQGAAVATPPTDDFLIRQLYSRGDPRLQDIVATIQAEQDAIIRTPLGRSLLLHGVAGSGKTSVAYHRLAYLMFTDHTYNLQPEQILVIGPNRTFLGYVRDLLPSLGVNGIAQRTFSDWLWERVRKNNRTLPDSVKFTDPVAQALADPERTPAERDRLWRSARLRGSLRFKQLIERHLTHLSSHPPLPVKPLKLSFLDQDKGMSSGEPRRPRSRAAKNTLLEPAAQTEPVLLETTGPESPFAYELTPETLQQLWMATDHSATLAARRSLLIRAATQHLAHAFAKVSPAPDNRTKQETAQLKTLQATVSRYITQAWPVPDLLELFEQMFRSEHLEAAASELFSPGEQRMLQATRPMRQLTRQGDLKDQPSEIDMSDLAGLFVMNNLLYGNQGASYRHLVVDEAQDFSPFQMALILEACPSRSVTIVGDTAQSIFAYRGIEHWDELSELLPADAVSQHLILQNYRSTREIVHLGNAVQRSLNGPDALQSTAFQREGPSPVLTVLPDLAQHQTKLISDLRHLLDAGHASIAVITADQAGAQAMGELLSGNDLPSQVLTEDSELTPKDLHGLVVLPVSLAKGLEFAAVVIADASEKTYPSSSRYAGNLLYVALSRALHELRVYAVERFSGWLDLAHDTAVVDHSQLKRAPVNWATTTLLAHVRQIRRERRAWPDIQREIAPRVTALLRGGQIEELLDVYAVLGQISEHSTNDLLTRLAAVNAERFMIRVLMAGVPEMLREQFEIALDNLDREQPEQARLYRAQLDAVLEEDCFPEQFGDD
ncbi:DNA helicase UvrD (plasmid) [Deinococcus psychrotolerans]|uniref:DNA helicase UvrD n=1 Tax=Deinococcus psychrotolerans TaxID=2489213 RepID=A0A3G8YJ10_9DEIO|nr:UvrD-helicase domain-containing protein [Deinococcus psychrotolerans]AZI45232.1 DNA helicase UvrD [Deinococcus psychrotolerans]